MSVDVMSCKCRIYPNIDFQILFKNNFGACRFVNNEILPKVEQARIHNKLTDKYKKHPKYCDEDKIIINRSFYNDCLRELKHENPFLYESDSTSLQDACDRLQESYKRYDKKISGKPKIKTLKNPVQSFTIKNVNNSIRIEEGYIRLNKYGFIKLHDNRKIIGKIKTVTIECKKGRWYAVITYALNDSIKPNLPKTGKIVGIDVGLTNYITLSTGEVIAKPDTSELDEKIDKQHKIISRRYNEGNFGTNYLKAIEKLWKLKNKKEDILNDLYHKISKKIVEKYDTIVMETLNIQGMLKNKNLSRSIHNAGWYRLKQMIKYKADLYGKTFIEISQWYPSTKKCHHCGYKNKNLTLKDREWTCPECGQTLSRDHNAAINILKEGLKKLKNEPRGHRG